MKTSKRDKHKALKKYIEDTFSEMLYLYPEAMHWNIIFKNEETNNSGGIMTIGMDFNNATMVLKVFRNTFDKSKSYIYTTIAHEIGHIFIQPLNNLVSQTYINEVEHDDLVELTATRIAWLIERLVYKRNKKPNKSKPKKKKKVDKVDKDAK